jgi:hypothetical protein
MDTVASAGRKGGIARKQRLTPDRMRQIGELGGRCSVAARRERRERARAQAAILHASSNLAQFSRKERERLIFHANEIERIILTRQGVDVPEGEACPTS